VLNIVTYFTIYTKTVTTCVFQCKSNFLFLPHRPTEHLVN